MKPQIMIAVLALLSLTSLGCQGEGQRKTEQKAPEVWAVDLLEEYDTL